ncbi:hypothetical protein M885DRAFT_513140 [Pelagophyceae sp. CCMP2097]|nr:hypothetical protein M885DRAFT_513140 [Pelagophyceae sp. CCMP2097]
MAKGSRSGEAKAAKGPEPAAVVDDYGDDGFEDYEDDDFEEPETMMQQAPAMPKASRANPTLVASIPARKSATVALTDLGAIQDAVKQENAGTAQRARALQQAAATHTAEAKTAAPAARSAKGAGAGAKQAAKPAKYGGGGASFGSLQNLDPRVRRARLVRESVRLGGERFAAFDQPPLTQHQIYRLRLRSAAAPCREVAAATADDAVDAGVQCEPVESADKEMQFALGDDDTDFENMIRGLKEAAVRRRPAKSEAKGDDEGKGGEGKGDDGPALPAAAAVDGESLVSTMRLPEFVRNVAPVVDLLLDEADAARDAALHKGDGTGGAVFAPGDWTRLGGAKDDAAPVGRVVFSRVRATVLLALHTDEDRAPERGEGKTAEERPASKADFENRVRVSVWETTAAAGPTALLRGAGVPTCACFAPCNGFVVAAGTAAGALLLWDLRERAAADDGGALQLGEEVGKHDAAFSTAPVGSAASGTAHASRVCALAPLGDATGAVTQRGRATFQLASLDDRGLIAIWLVIEAPAARPDLAKAAAALSGGAQHGALSASDETYLGLRAGGRLRLQCSRTVAVWASVPASVTAARGGAHANRGDALGRMLLREAGDDGAASLDSLIAAVGVGPGVTPAFAASPADANEFLVALSDGHVVRCSRLGAAKEPRVFYSSEAAMRLAISGAAVPKAAPRATVAETKGDDAPPPPPVAPSSGAQATSVAFSPFAPDVFLVGQRDGGLRLHRLAHAMPLVVWPCCAAAAPAASKKGFGSFLSTPVADVRWSPDRPALFFVLYETGDLFTFDLLRDDCRPSHACPLAQELGAAGGARRPPTLDVSCARGAAHRKSVGVTVGGRVFFRTLADAATVPQPDELSRFSRILDNAI